MRLKDVAWFASCGKADPLYAANSRFIREMQGRGTPVSVSISRGGHDWQSWNEAMPLLFRSAKETLSPSGQQKKATGRPVAKSQSSELKRCFSKDYYLTA
jgi:hypothetical protein